MSAHVQISSVRVAGMGLLLVAVLAGVCALVRLLPATPPGYAAALAFGLVRFPSPRRPSNGRCTEAKAHPVGASEPAAEVARPRPPALGGKMSAAT